MKIAAIILTIVLTVVVNSAVGFFMFGALIVGMNGFPSAKSAEPGIYLYSIWTVLSVILMGALSALLVYFLAKKKFNVWLAGLISFAIFSIIGSVGIVIGWGAGLAFASYLFTNR